MMQIAKPGDKRDGVRLRMRSMILRRHSDAQQGPAQNVRQNLHLVNPPELNFEIVLQDGGLHWLGTIAPCKRAQLMPNLSACQVGEDEHDKGLLSNTLIA